MSTINVTNLSGRGGATPNLPDGAIISGVTTATNVSVSGAVTATTFDGSLKSTGTPTLGLGVTINSSGIHVSGVATVGVLTGGTYYGDGSNLAGVGESTAPWHYNPDVSKILAPYNTGIGITFNKKVVAGSGTATLKVVNAGAAGTTIQSWGVSSCTFNVTEFTLGSLVSNLTRSQTFQLDIPSGFIVDSTGTAYAGTAYTFAVQDPDITLWSWGYGNYGALAQNNTTEYSSPVQIPALTWAHLPRGYSTANGALHRVVAKTDGTLWAWGRNQRGRLGDNSNVHRSSPVQIPGTTWARGVVGLEQTMAVKTDGTLWTWGTNESGVLAQNTVSDGISSPVQVPGTTWGTAANKLSNGERFMFALRTDGTLWAWGWNQKGVLGQNSPEASDRSSPVQIPGTTWSSIPEGSGFNCAGGIKTDGTMWTWGENSDGTLGIILAPGTNYSSPVQIPGTSWHKLAATKYSMMASRTDGTLWTWGQNDFGELGLNDRAAYSSPTQLPGTTWSTTGFGFYENACYSVKTDGTLWAWGKNASGQLGLNTVVAYSSPVQVGSDTNWTDVSGLMVAFQESS